MFFRQFVFGYRYLGDSGTDRHEILHDGTHQSRTESLPFWGRYSHGNPKSQILALYKNQITPER